MEEEFWTGHSNVSLIICCDNQSTITLSRNEGYHGQSKHIDVRFHFVREKMAAK